MSKTLLLADDSVVIQKLVGLSFANEDVEIVTTDNGDDAVTKAQEVVPDVVLADVVMPGKSGYEVCEAIKQDPALAHIPVLLLTGTFEAFDEGRASAAGANGQITKPFEAQSLVERVNEVMNAAAADASAAQASTGGEAASSDFDFFDSSVSSLADSADGSVPPPVASAVESDTVASGPTTGADTPNFGRRATDQMTDQTPAIDVADDSLFGAPGDGATDDLHALDTQGGDLALGESVAADPGDADASVSPGFDLAEGDATVVALPDPVEPLPPSQGDPLVEYADDLRQSDAAATPVDLGSALDSVPTDPGATIVAGVDDRNASTSPNYSPDMSPDMSAATSEPVTDAGDLATQTPSDDEFDDLTVHVPASGIDHAAAAAPSPAAPDPSADTPAPDAGATVVANLDVSLAEPEELIAAATESNPLDLGPSNVSADELDFAFDVSEQAPASETPDRLGDSFSSLMDISESQILVGPSDDDEAVGSVGTSDDFDFLSRKSEGDHPVIDDSIAAGYDVSASDLATALPPAVSARPSAPTGDAPPSAPVASTTGAESASGDDLEIGPARSTGAADARVTDLSPMVEQRIQETLEKVAWEAFSDLSETIVKQVLGRVEQIAWEVIPQMAETLVREEIRKMKGETD